ncbi:MAG: ferrous iron transporter B, partial [Clostridia bacterium]|nr:ferrous iron transporter B [Clostridia bacterium]
ALKSTGIAEAAEAAIEAAKHGIPQVRHNFSGTVEHALAHIEEATVHDLPGEQQRWYAIKVFERDEKVLEMMQLPDNVRRHIEQDILCVEAELDDDAESIITNERYEYVASVLKNCYKKKNIGKLTVSDKIDTVLTNRFAALPIFALIMFLVYFLSVTTVGTWATDWMNDGVFGDGWHAFNVGVEEYDAAMEGYASENLFTEEFLAELSSAEQNGVIGADSLLQAAKDADFGTFDEEYGVYGSGLSDMAQSHYDEVMGAQTVPDPASFGWWVPGVPVIFDSFLLNEAGEPAVTPWLYSLIQDGIVGGVGAVLGFVPQMLMLFLLLAFLEACGYMSRIAFVLDRLFRKFGLSGKSFIPMLVGTGCGVPGIMASRTIENERDRRMTIITTTFIPCGAKLPIIALIAAAMFDGAWWVAPSAYFVGMAAIVVSGIMLKKTKLFAGDPAPFVMELPPYHMPTLPNVLRSMWERGWSFIRKAGTVILLSTVLIWFVDSFGFADGAFGYLPAMGTEGTSLISIIGNAVAWLFAPLGFGEPTAAVATLMGLLAKEEVVAVFGVTDFAGLTQLSAYSFMLFNLLCAPCFAAMGAIRREMNSAKWTMFAIGYQCVFAYAVSLMVFQFGLLFAGQWNVIGLAAAVLVLGFMLYMLFRPYKESTHLTMKLK